MRIFVLGFLLALSTVCAGLCNAQTAQPAKAQKQPAQHELERQKANENVLILLGGPTGGPYIQLAQDLATAFNDSDNLRVMPMIGEGAVKNVRDILLLRGVDLGISTVQVLNSLKTSGEYGPNLDRRIAYIAPLSVDMFHVLARPEYKSLQDLKGKKVSFQLKGSATAAFGPKVLKALGIEVTEVHVFVNDAIQLMRNGELDAAVCICPVPVPAFPPVKSEWGFKFLEVPYIPALENDYLPAGLTSAQYPNLVIGDSKVRTIATSTVLIAYNWSPGTERYRRIEKFVEVFFSNFDKLRQPPRHPAWRDVNISASIPGWQRFGAAQRWLDRQAAEEAAKAQPRGIDPAHARAQAAKAAPHDRAEQERLFNEFIEWTRRQPKRQ